MLPIQLLRATALLLLSVVVTVTDEQRVNSHRDLEAVMARRHQILLAAKPVPFFSPIPLPNPTSTPIPPATPTSTPTPIPFTTPTPIPLRTPIPVVQAIATLAGPPSQVPTFEELSKFPGPPAIRPFNELTTETERVAFREHTNRLVLQSRRAQAISRHRHQLRRN